MRRTFFALWPDASWRGQLLGAAQARIAGCAGRVLASVDLHVTLCFLGAIEESNMAALCQRAALLQAPEFELAFDALEYWPQSRVLAATGSQVPEAATTLACALRASARSLGLYPDEQPLRPHVTLVRAAQTPQRPPGHALALSPPLRFAARRFYLAQSHELEAATATAAQTGRYARLASWPLRAVSR
jgi:RNA 2',3'-cyclic 3'-phosphodiesterase